MKRRDVFKLIPVSAAGLANFPVNSSAQVPDGFVAISPDQPLALQYLKIIRDRLEKIRNTESDNMLEASYKIAETVKKGGTCYNQWDMGHNITFDLFPDRHGDPGLFTNGFKSGGGKDGDLLLMSIVPDWMPLENPHDKGVFVIGGPAPWSAETPNPELLTERNAALKYRHFSDLWINLHHTTYGPVIWLPGESWPMGPSSGPVGLMTFWMMNADASRILARDKYPLKVRGDEPVLGEKSPRESVNKPLGHVYFDEAMKQLLSIETELGTINKMADAVVESILAGGKIHNYSRYENSLCYESTYRRGGLLFNRGVFAGEDGPKGGGHFPDFKGTNKDVMIMGVFQPDDPVNLRDLKAFRKLGMKVFSIGTATRNGRIPDGDTVPKLADLHLGNMCDTYGLFALPGVERKVCPTSGLLLNQMFYALQMQIAEKIIERTGNHPRFDANAAMKGALEKRQRDLEIIKVRGY